MVRKVRRRVAPLRLRKLDLALLAVAEHLDLPRVLWYRPVAPAELVVLRPLHHHVLDETLEVDAVDSLGGLAHLAFPPADEHRLVDVAKAHLLAERIDEVPSVSPLVQIELHPLEQVGHREREEVPCPRSVVERVKVVALLRPAYRSEFTDERLTDCGVVGKTLLAQDHVPLHLPGKLVGHRAVEDADALPVVLVLHGAEAHYGVQPHHGVLPLAQSTLRRVKVSTTLRAEVEQLLVGQVQDSVQTSSLLVGGLVSHPHRLLDVLPVFLKPWSNLALVVRH